MKDNTNLQTPRIPPCRDRAPAFAIPRSVTLRRFLLYRYYPKFYTAANPSPRVPLHIF